MPKHTIRLSKYLASGSATRESTVLMTMQSITTDSRTTLNLAMFLSVVSLSVATDSRTTLNLAMFLFVVLLHISVRIITYDTRISTNNIV